MRARHCCAKKAKHQHREDGSAEETLISAAHSASTSERHGGLQVRISTADGYGYDPAWWGSRVIAAAAVVCDRSRICTTLWACCCDGSDG